MILRSVPHCLPALGLVLAGVVCPAGELWAQKPPPPVKPNPLAPVIALPAPLGVQRGTSLELTLSGNNLADPTGLLTGFPDRVTLPPENKNGQGGKQLRI